MSWAGTLCVCICLVGVAVPILSVMRSLPWETALNLPEAHDGLFKEWPADSEVDSDSVGKGDSCVGPEAETSGLGVAAHSRIDSDSVIKDVATAPTLRGAAPSWRLGVVRLCRYSITRFDRCTIYRA
jgi:hypothetical protein